MIKSIQNSTVTITAVQTSSTTSIAAVNTANSVLNYLNYNCTPTAASIREDSLLLELTNATTITGSHDTAGNDILGGFQVVEYLPGVIRRVQRGTITITNGNSTNTATITAVNTAKAELTFLGQSYTAIAATDFRARLDLTNATTITATRNGTTDNVTVGYQLVEWY